MDRQKIRAAKALMVIAAVSGGSLFTSCVGRVRMAAIDGSTSVFFDMLNQTAADIVADIAGDGE